MILDLTAMQKAVKSLENGVGNACDSGFMNRLTESQKQLIIAGVIQNFEFTYERSWKFIKRWLSENIGNTHVDGVTRRELFRLAAQSRLIDDVDKWMFYHAARNQASHIYDEEIAQEVFEAAKEFVYTAKELLAQLEARND
jgi:nucleotidyltransferase substrate binding protein (TIGR01987 family)